MRIRAITIGQKIPIFYQAIGTEEFLENKMEKFGPFYKDLINEFKKNKISVDSKRICSQPLLKYEEQLAYRKDVQQTLSLIENELEILSKIFKKNNIDYFACCTMLADELENFGLFEKLLLNDFDKLLKKFPNFFSSLPVISQSGINFMALKSGARIIKRLAEPDPFNNLRFCVSCNVPPNTPFFPAAYHKTSEKAAFSLALEMADEVVSIFNKSSDLSQAKLNLKEKFNEIYEKILRISEKISYKHDLDFIGMDLSPAPFPNFDRSIGQAIEELGIEYFGAYGSLLGINLITSCIPKRDKIIGFSGFMQPVFEDSILSKRLREERYNIDTLLLYSTICGTGLDCVPLPGNITERELFYILLDLCIISLKHNKPLTARLMPIPGKNAGDDIKFDFEYFAPTKIMDIKRLTEKKSKDIFDRNEKTFNFL
ncbi:MAG: DUF711 family protein [Promethearchaeota archaeon]|nr:MAG: DUF711 family protein [Candidatus Lokiarchaeota archaeon]